MDAGGERRDSSRWIRIDADARRAVVGAGCLWHEVHTAAAAFGLVAPSGVAGQAAVPDFTPGGGVGLLTRSHGRTIDNLLELELDLGDGRHERLPVPEGIDLLPGLHHGCLDGRPISQLNFRLHPIDRVVGGPTFWPLEEAPAVLRWFRDFIAEAPPELNGYFVVRQVPALSQYPQAIHGRTACAVVWCHTGGELQAERDLAPLRGVGTAAILGLRPTRFIELQREFDRLHPASVRWHRRVARARWLDDVAIDKHLRHAVVLPTAHSELQIHVRDARRGSGWLEMLSGGATSTDDLVRIQGWCREWWDDLHRGETASVYATEAAPVTAASDGEGA